MPPLDSCTYLAADNGAIPVAFDIYSDMLLVLGMLTLLGKRMNFLTFIDHPIAKGTEKESYLSKSSRLSSSPARVRLLREVQVYLYRLRLYINRQTRQLGITFAPTEMPG